MTSIANRYQVLAPLARGGMGEILLARRLGPAGFEKLVVLKRPLPHLAGSGPIVESLVEEARLLARINHPNVCQVYDLEETDGHYYLALEYLEGLSLWTLLASTEASGGVMDPRAVCGLIEQACDGLDAIHALIGAVHRDISPGNLMLTETGAVKILDLGIAKTADSADLTPFGRVKGKLPYVAPEQARGHAIDARADVFALGLVTYDLARGRRPGDRIGALAADSLELDVMAPQLADLVRTATAIDPAARFASARDMGAAARRAGAALGGSYDRAALATWLAANFLPDLARRRAWLDAALDDAAPRPEPTQILSLRSLLPVDDRPPPAQPPPIPRPRETERLELPEHERIAIAGGTSADPAMTGAATTGSSSGAAWGGDAATTTGSSSGAAWGGDAATTTGSSSGAAWGGDAATTTGSSSGAAWGGDAATTTNRAAAGIAPSRGRGSRPIVLLIAASLVVGIVVAIVIARGGNSPSVDPASAAPHTAARESPPADRATMPPADTAESTAPATPPEPAIPIDRAPPPTADIAVPHIHHEPVHRTARAEPGQLTVGSDPYAVVRLGSRSLGQTPLYRITLPPGRHRLHATTEDGREQDVSVVVESGREAKLRLDWK